MCNVQYIYLVHVALQQSGERGKLDIKRGWRAMHIISSLKKEAKYVQVHVPPMLFIDMCR